MQEAVGQGFPTSPDPLPLSYAVRYASRLSVAGPDRLHRHTAVPDSLHRSPVREKISCVEITLHIDTQIFGLDHRGFLPFLSTWNQCRFSVDTCSFDCLSTATVVTNQTL
jgi:hypothetical protein